METSHLRAYCGLLDIRYKAAHRNLTIAGVVFLVALAAFLALGMLGKLSRMEIYVAAAMLIALALAFLSILIRWEILAGQRELCRYLIQNNQAN